MAAHSSITAIGTTMPTGIKAGGNGSSSFFVF
jgi:hypothetical protein